MNPKKNRESLLRKAFSRMGAADRQAAEAFSNARSWVGEYALYCAAKARFGGAPWYEWPDRALRRHEPHALARWREELREEVAFHTCLQFWFFTQWESLKRYVNDLGIQIMGDLPIYVSLDSADVWAEREQFLLDEEGRPERVAGVPPDYFSAEGQLWGNPLYNWAFMEEDGFGWWIRRVDGAIRLFDAVRIDHFRGLESFWSVPADAGDRQNGPLEQGPGMKLLRVLNEWFRDAGAPFVAEDLGLLTEDVHRLREAAGLPGMKVLEFAFTGPDNAYLPHHYDPPASAIQAPMTTTRWQGGARRRNRRNGTSRSGIWACGRIRRHCAAPCCGAGRGAWRRCSSPRCRIIWGWRRPGLMSPEWRMETGAGGCCRIRPPLRWRRRSGS